MSKFFSLSYLKALLAFIGCLACLPSSPARTEEERWYTVHLLGQKVGYARDVEKPGELISEAAWSLDRGGIQLFQTMKSTVRLDANHRPMSFISEQYDGTQTKIIEGHLHPGQVALKTILSGVTTETAIMFPDHGVLGSLVQKHIQAGLSSAPLNQGIKKVVLMEDSGQLVTLTTAKIPTVQLTLAGRTESAVPVEIQYGGLPLTSKMFFSETSGEMMLHETDFGGFLLVMSRATKEEALKSEVRQGKSLDMLVTFRVPIDRPLPVPAPHSGKIQITVKKGTIPDIPSGVGQSYDGQTRVLTLKTVEPPKSPVKFPFMDPALKPYLEPTLYEQSQDPGIRDAAKAIVAGETHAWPAVKKISSWVHRHIQSKSYAVGFASAKEVFNGRQGDCTEHAVLMGALCKAVGIPTRTVVGLLGQGEGFLYHMWVECFVGDWIPVDPTWDQAPADLWHIKYRDGILDDSGFFSMGVSMLPILNKLEFRLLGTGESGPKPKGKSNQVEKKGSKN